MPQISHNDAPAPLQNPLSPPLPQRPGEALAWARLYGSSRALVIASAAAGHPGPVVVVTEDTQSAYQLRIALRFYAGGTDLPVLEFPDWETLPYDVFSPYQDIVSQRLASLARLPALRRGILVVPVSTLMQRLAPRDFLDANSLMLDVGDRFDLDGMRRTLEASGYRCVPQVMEHGEFAVRGSLIDLYPMGSEQPYRIDLFDDEVETIRGFDPETQLSSDRLPAIHLLPAREFPLTEDSIARFRQGFRALFAGDPQRSPVYRDVSQGIAPGGIEYYLPLFFSRTETLLEYLPAQSLMVCSEGVPEAAERFWTQVRERYEQGRHDVERPLLGPERLFLDPAQLSAGIERLLQVRLQRFEQPDASAVNYATAAPPVLTLEARAAEPSATLRRFISEFQGRVLFAAETVGRREALLGMLRDENLHPRSCAGWAEFLASDAALAITVAPLDEGLLLGEPPVAVVAEPQLFGERVQQRRRRKPATRDPESIIRNLTELEIGAPVVHEDHGVGRYRGLQLLRVGDIEAEFLTLEYADGDRLYVPVSSLHLISRYTGAGPEAAPLHKLGGDQWQRAKRKAAERARDVAAELLEIYARRAARPGRAACIDAEQYAAFAAAFPFEETPDQQATIDSVLQDMRCGSPMDRVVCGDVGFGKTEVAMRAAFVAVQDNRQVAVLVPTTLLAQQHYQNFRDRFADWPVRIEALSRFSSRKRQEELQEALAAGTIDIIIGTHKLLQAEVRFRNLGLVIMDEEHRFGVRQKERLKSLRAEVDVLTLTATPIPRTLNMSLAGLRDLSMIATPPAHRHAIKTFVHEWNDTLIREACLREIKRGGQIYFLHNEVQSIERAARRVRELVPEASVRLAHGQMRERELEQVMLDFYHRRLTCWSARPSSKAGSTFQTPTPSSSSAPTSWGWRSCTSCAVASGAPIIAPTPT